MLSPAVTPISLGLRVPSSRREELKAVMEIRWAGIPEALGGHSLRPPGGFHVCKGLRDSLGGKRQYLHFSRCLPTRPLGSSWAPTFKGGEWPLEPTVPCRPSRPQLTPLFFQSPCPRRFLCPVMPTALGRCHWPFGHFSCLQGRLALISHSLQRVSLLPHHPRGP